MTRHILFLLIIITLISSSSSDNKHASHALVLGKLYCDTCFQHTPNFISGVNVVVECEHKGNVVRKRARTDRRGMFRVRLPLTLIQSCSVELIRTTHPYCAVATSASSSVHLHSKRHRVFSAGLFTFQPSLCSRKPVSLSPFPPPLEDPADPGDLPPLPRLPIPDIPLPELPLPQLPRLPIRLPNLPPLITARRTAEIHPSGSGRNIRTREFFFPPNPLQPPLIPNPFQPPPPLLPNPFQPPPPLLPNPFQPPPAPPGLPNPFQPPLLPIPPLPGLTPSPPPPAFGFPFPPFPFRPPGVPGTPPRRKP